MTFSATKLIGAAVWRTMQALNRDEAFLHAIQQYEFWLNCCDRDGALHLWHYPGTPNEIANVLVNIGKRIDGASLKFPAVLDFLPIRQMKDSRTDGKAADRITYNLAIVAPVRREWLSETRERYVFEPLLRPIYNEFVRQLKRMSAFITGYDMPHDYYEVFTTGGSAETVAQRYGDYIDAIEIHDLTLTVAPNLCDRDLMQLYKENDLVSDNINNIITK